MAFNARNAEGDGEVQAERVESDKDPRQEGGSEMGEERAAEIAGWFEYASSCLDMYGKSLLSAARINVNRFVRSALELPGIAALKKIVNPHVFLLDPPKFRGKDALGDIRGLVKKSCEKLASLDMARAGDDRKGIVDGEWANRARDNFDGVARLTHLDRKYPDALSKIKLGPGEEE